MESYSYKSRGVSALIIHTVCAVIMMNWQPGLPEWLCSVWLQSPYQTAGLFVFSIFCYHTCIVVKSFIKQNCKVMLLTLMSYVTTVIDPCRKLAFSHFVTDNG